MYMESRRIQKAVKGDEDLQFCYSMLNRVSRSFSIVIQMLPESLRDPICVFYLTLRALDTVEDDMALPNERKLPLLHTFHDKLKDECAPTRPLQQLKLVLLRVHCSARSLEPTMGVGVLFKLHSALFETEVLYVVATLLQVLPCRGMWRETLQTALGAVPEGNACLYVP